jgi:hypothetical protein
VRLLLVGVVDVADEHVVPGRQVDGQALRVVNRDVFDLTLQLEAFAFFIHAAVLVRGQRVGCQVGQEDDELVDVVRPLVGDVERHVAGGCRR